MRVLNGVDLKIKFSYNDKNESKNGVAIINIQFIPKNSFLPTLISLKLDESPVLS